MLKRILLAILFVPQICFASVKISEVAWMGTVDSSSNEWIELVNNGGEEVNLSGYKIISTDDGLSVSLKGTISPNSYYLIERTDDTSVPSITADLIATFGSGLSNAGETLRLLNSEGQVIDEVIGGTDWKNIGGSSVTKNTPQWNGTKWITATSTPRFACTAEESVVDTTGGTPESSQAVVITTTTSSSGSSSHSSSKKAEPIKVVRDSLKIVVKHDGNILKDAPELFTVKVFGLSDEELPNAKVIWNFGDGTTAEGKEVKHAFRFAGIYSLVIKASHNDLSTVLRTRIEVLDQKIKILLAEPGFEGFVRIISENDTDISGWSLRNGGSSFIFPEGTMLYAKTPVTVANSITGIINQDSLALHRPGGKIISVFGDLESEVKVITSNIPYSKKLSVSNAKETQLENVSSNTPSSTLLAMATAAKSSGFPNWIYLAAIAFFVVVIGAIVYMSKVFNSNREVEDEASKYTLVEIDSNLE